MALRSEVAGSSPRTAFGAWLVLEIVSGIRTVERFVAQRKIGNDVALDGGFKQRPLKPRRVAQMAPYHAIAVEAHPSEHVAAEAFGKSQTLRSFTHRRECVRGGPIRQPGKYLLDKRKALLDLAG